MHGRTFEALQQLGPDLAVFDIHLLHEPRHGSCGDERRVPLASKRRHHRLRAAMAKVATRVRRRGQRDRWDVLFFWYPVWGEIEREGIPDTPKVQTHPLNPLNPRTITSSSTTAITTYWNAPQYMATTGTWRPKRWRREIHGSPPNPQPQNEQK